MKIQSGPWSAGFTRIQLICLHTVSKWCSWNSKCNILHLVKKQSGSGSAGFTRNLLIWLHTVFKWYSWNRKCNILLLVISYSWWKTVWTQISWLHQKSAYLTSYCFQMILLNNMFYLTLGEEQSGPRSAGFTRNQLIWLHTVFSNDTLEIVNVISYSWWKTVWSQISWFHQKSAYLTSYCFQMILLK